MIDRANAEEVVYRTAVSAFTYYPGKEASDPGYVLDADVAWCSAPLIDLPAELLTEVRDTIRNLITDPLADRRGFIGTLNRLVQDAGGAG
ncbi:hypothetical protein GCM10009776_25680 [Microbacterium deminutum]|uniref:Uncharacterized protein n=2 Tax=Microbacterium deminutum TaxID=344164 RepID=A0ABN2R1B5_9MICO